MKYYNTFTKTELFLLGPSHLIYTEVDPDHVELLESNPYFLPIPEGEQLTYDIDGIPTGTEPIPAPIYTVEEQAALDLEAAGVTTYTLSTAAYSGYRGDSAPILAIDASIDAVVISSGLTLSQVINLI